MAVVTGGVCLFDKCPQHKNVDELVVLYVGRLMKFKGIESSLQAFAYARARTTQKLRMLIVGEGPEQDHLKLEIKRTGMPGVHFVGKIDYPGVLKIYQLENVFSQNQALFNCSNQFGNGNAIQNNA